jgi:hypothetical protein
VLSSLIQNNNKKGIETTIIAEMEKKKHKFLTKIIAKKEKKKE